MAYQPNSRSCWSVPVSSFNWRSSRNDLVVHPVLRFRTCTLQIMQITQTMQIMQIMQITIATRCISPHPQFTAHALFPATRLHARTPTPCATYHQYTHVSPCTHFPSLPFLPFACVAFTQSTDLKVRNQGTSLSWDVVTDHTHSVVSPGLQILPVCRAAATPHTFRLVLRPYTLENTCFPP
jgi:hypothetical protein